VYLRHMVSPSVGCAINAAPRQPEATASGIIAIRHSMRSGTGTRLPVHAESDELRESLLFDHDDSLTPPAARARRLSSSSSRQVSIRRGGVAGEPEEITCTVLVTVEEVCTSWSQ
jgi:hypothetical protein